jgi:hypothetical protein
MFCGCNVNIPFWQWLIVSKKFPFSIGCYDYPKLYLEKNNVMHPGIPCHKLSILWQYLYFLVRGLLFKRELLNQRFTAVEFNSSLRKFMVTIIHWLTVTEICATSFVFFTIPSTHSSFMSNSTGSINEEGTYYSSWVHESTPVVGFL